GDTPVKHTIQGASYLRHQIFDGHRPEVWLRGVLRERPSLAIGTEMPRGFQVKRLSPPDVLVNLLPDLGQRLRRLVFDDLPARLRRQSLPQLGRLDQDGENLDHVLVRRVDDGEIEYGIPEVIV